MGLQDFEVIRFST